MMGDLKNDQENYVDLLERLSKGIKKITPEDIKNMSEEQKENFRYVQKRLEKGGQGE